MKPLKCLDCRKPIIKEFKHIQKKCNNKLITIRDIPYHYCDQCKKTFYTKEVLNVLDFITHDWSDDKRMLVLYETVFEKYIENEKAFGQTPDEEDKYKLSSYSIYQKNSEDSNQSTKKSNILIAQIMKNKDLKKINIIEESKKCNKLDDIFCGNYYEGCKTATAWAECVNIKCQQVMVYHYTGINPFKSIVMETHNDYCKLKISKDFVLMNFLEGEPAVLKFSQDNKMCVIGSTVADIDLSNMIATFNFDQITGYENQRRSERIPVSIYVEIHKFNSIKREKYTGIVKDISFNGLLIYTKFNLDTEIGFEIDLYTRERIIYLTTSIAKKQYLGNYYAYGVNIINIDESSMDFLKKHIKYL